MINISNVSVKNIRNTVNTKNIKNVETTNKGNFKSILKKSKKEDKSSNNSVTEEKCKKNAKHDKKMEYVSDKTDKNTTNNNTNNNICKETKDNTKTNVKRKEVYDEILALLNEMGLKKYCVVLDDKAGDKYKIKLLDLIKDNDVEIKNMIINSLKVQGIRKNIAEETSKDIMSKLLNIISNNDITNLDNAKLKDLMNNMQSLSLENHTNNVETSVLKDIISAIKKELVDMHEEYKNINEGIKQKKLIDMGNKNSKKDFITKVNTKSNNNFNLRNELFVNNNDLKKSDNLLSDDNKLLKSIIHENNKAERLKKNVNFMNQFKTFELRDFGNTKYVKPIIINKSNFVGDIVKSVKFMNENGLKNLSVKIMPKELGEIMIKVTMDSGVMKAQISASNKETFNLLNANMQNITDKINSSEIRIENIDINLNNDESNFFNQQFGNGRESRQDNKSSMNFAEIDLDNDEITDMGAKYFHGNVNAFV
ncbi:flagellar hook-length control protein FliK [Clostridium tepidiprofundi DSM 19306]|uniref:Flagellar hook-length control protein FliK n=1 Tax=Clostridium tepidiprofundi DSM 19306 TaxID=1121338 RepID=A0A151B5A0_9CLOT|nr:flagellar hook-length control protein FliK [Clostridium tepidiprofundi]KYH35075.1 flagellar hook-length control protein FliK [Clostridium tepidiprofundi DSM 19306]